MPQIVHAADYLYKESPELIVDVRTPSEFQKGHVPGAINIPLFDDEGRAMVGTVYHRQNKEAAVLKGLELVGPTLADKVKALKKQYNKFYSLDPSRNHSFNLPITLYCWRGGMRSNSMAWLFETAGFTVNLISGGYKAYRTEVLAIFNQPFPLIILGGATGTKKTLILSHLATLGEEIIDLEMLANHKGSAFGALGQPPQPSVEFFENNLAYLLKKSSLKGSLKRIWIEDESRHIGSCFIPEGFYHQMQSAPMYLILASLKTRIEYLVKEYGTFPTTELALSLKSLARRVGGDKINYALEALEMNNLTSVVATLLPYYDKAYQHSIDLRINKEQYTLETTNLSLTEIASTLISTVEG